jgi:hypothetical protein
MEDEGNHLVLMMVLAFNVAFVFFNKVDILHYMSWYILTWLLTVEQERQVPSCTTENDDPNSRRC